METEKRIKTMKLYSHFDRVDNELRAAGKAPDSTLIPSDLSKFDNMHYEGLSAVENAIEKCGLRESTNSLNILDCGSGLGGPARHIASTCSSCHVVALELQQDCSGAAEVYSRRCGLTGEGAGRIEHMCGDIMRGDTLSLITKNDMKFDAVVSWLVYLHISDKDTLFKNCHQVMNANGMLYIEDFYNKYNTGDVQDVQKDCEVAAEAVPVQHSSLTQVVHDTALEAVNTAVAQALAKTPNSPPKPPIGDCSPGGRPFSDDDNLSLRTDVACDGSSLPTISQYKDTLINSGFKIVEFTDLTDSWSQHVEARLADWVANKDRAISIHNMDIYESLLGFFDAIAKLFRGGNGQLGGCRIVAQKA